MGWDLQSIALLQHCSLQFGHQTHQLNVLVVPHKRCLKVEQLGHDTFSGLLNYKGRSESFPSFPIHQTITCKCFQLKCYGFYKCMLPWKFNISVFGKNLISDPSPKKKQRCEDMALVWCAFCCFCEILPSLASRALASVWISMYCMWEMLSQGFVILLWLRKYAMYFECT